MSNTVGNKISISHIRLQKRRKDICGIKVLVGQLINMEDTPYFHGYVRCIRCTFICGNDKYSGNNYDHRCEWIKDKTLS